MRKVISLLLSVVLLFSLTAQALAATVTQQVSSTAVRAGEEVVVTVSLDETMNDLIAVEYLLFYDSGSFELVSSEGSALTISEARTDKNGQAYYAISKTDFTTLDGFSVEAGNLAVLRFKALENVTEEKLAAFQLTKETLWDTSWECTNIDDGSVENGEVSITVSPAAANTYTVTLTEGEGYTITAAEGSESPVTEGGSYSFTVTVNEGYEGTPVVKANGTELTAVDGVYTIANITEAQTVTVEGITAKVNTYTVTLPEGEGYTIAATEGSTSPVTEGGSYSFTVTVSEGYEGTPVVKANDTQLTAADGVYTIENITVDQTVTVTGITVIPKTYAVTLTEGEGYTIAAKDSESPVKEGGSYSFTVTVNDGYEGTPVVKANGTELTAVDGVYTIENITENQTVTVSGIAVKPGSYMVTASEDVTTTVNAGAEITILVAGNADTAITAYNDYDVTVIYDPAKLSYVSAKAADDSAVITNDAAAGTIRITGHGDAKAYSDAVAALSFTALISGNQDVTISSAKIDNSGHAIGANAPEAAISDKTTVVKVAYSVELPDRFTGSDSVLPGADYTFTAPEDAQYMEITVKVGEDIIDPAQIDNGDGSYTIPDVNGNVVIEAKGKTYQVTKSGTNAAIDGADTAQYGQDYSFEVKAEAGYSVSSVMATINGESVSYTIDSTGAYVIAGKDIKGNVTITVMAAAAEENTTQITFSGIPAEEVVGGLLQTAANGEDFRFELNEAEGYTYTAMLDGVELKPDDNGIYTIPGAQINGTALTVYLTKTAETGTLTVEVSEYITLNEKVMWLVTATNGDKALAYGQEGTMYWSEQYNAYCYLVISTENADTVKAAAEAAITLTDEGTAVPTISCDRDVNQTGVVDINDAQLTYDMYSATYESFEKVSMDKFLEADLNGDKKVYTEDAAAIVNQIHPAVQNG